jgi:hypothetical protein
VVAPSLTPSPGDRIEPDRRDPVKLTRLHSAGELISVRTPDSTHETARRSRAAYLRCRPVIAVNSLRMRSQSNAARTSIPFLHRCYRSIPCRHADRPHLRAPWPTLLGNTLDEAAAYLSGTILARQCGTVVSLAVMRKHDEQTIPSEAQSGIQGDGGYSTTWLNCRRVRLMYLATSDYPPKRPWVRFPIRADSREMDRHRHQPQREKHSILCITQKEDQSFSTPP